MDYPYYHFKVLRRLREGPLAGYLISSNNTLPSWLLLKYTTSGKNVSPHGPLLVFHSRTMAMEWANTWSERFPEADFEVWLSTHNGEEPKRVQWLGDKDFMAKVQHEVKNSEDLNLIQQLWKALDESDSEKRDDAIYSILGPDRFDPPTGTHAVPYLYLTQHLATFRKGSEFVKEDASWAEGRALAEKGETVPYNSDVWLRRGHAFFIAIQERDKAQAENLLYYKFKDLFKTVLGLNEEPEK